ncbi:MAG: hypothetical protein U9Q75_12780 [Pseudomonadota bacterium]|nr:hypothetical protein [Pseudomonadota bacterium]
MNTRVETCVEKLCLKGCRVVWEDIRLLEEGVQLPETGGLLETERLAVLHELKFIMSVYSTAGSCEIDD